MDKLDLVLAGVIVTIVLQLVPHVLMLGRLQMWLIGCYPNAGPRPWIAWRLGNLISDVRYWTWRATGGKHEA